jgi:hypothetical protein
MGHLYFMGIMYSDDEERECYRIEDTTSFMNLNVSLPNPRECQYPFSIVNRFMISVVILREDDKMQFIIDTRETTIEEGHITFTCLDNTLSMMTDSPCSISVADSSGVCVYLRAIRVLMIFSDNKNQEMVYFVNDKLQLPKATHNSSICIIAPYLSKSNVYKHKVRQSALCLFAMCF